MHTYQLHEMHGPAPEIGIKLDFKDSPWSFVVVVFYALQKEQV